MKIEPLTVETIRTDPGFAFWSILVFIIFLGLIAAVIMKLMVLWVAALVFVAVVVLAMIFANLPDIFRYMRISSM